MQQIYLPTSFPPPKKALANLNEKPWNGLAGSDMYLLIAVIQVLDGSPQFLVRLLTQPLSVKVARLEKMPWLLQNLAHLL